MTRREQYHLIFQKITTPSGSVRYSCLQATATNESYYTGYILDSLSKLEAEDLISEINKALNNHFYDPYFSFNAAQGTEGVEIIPPNAIINEEYTIALNDFKELIQEWIAFLSN